MKQLERWFSNFKDYKKLNIHEAKELYNKYQSTEDESLKKEIFNQIIFGTMYVIYNYIKKNNMSYLETGAYDLDDILNSFVEEWIIAIKNNKLNEHDAYSTIMDRVVTRNVYKKVIGNETYPLPKNMFIEFLNSYIELRNYKEDLTYIEFYLYMKYKLANRRNINVVYFFQDIDIKEEKERINFNTYLYEDLFIKLTIIYNRIKNKETGLVELTRSKQEEYVLMLMEMCQYERLDYSMSNDTLEVDLLEKKMAQDLLEFIKKYENRIGTRDLDIFCRVNGVYTGHIGNLEEISNLYGITKTRVTQINARAGRRIRRLYNINKYNPNNS